METTHPLTQLPKSLNLGRYLLRSYPFERGRWRLSQLVTLFARLPERATFSFDFGTFVDTSLEDWPIGYRELFLYGRMDQKELAAWRRIVRPGDAVIDGGANYGYWTLVASRLVGPTGLVFSFEANPPTAARLKENIIASEATNVSVYPVALAAAEGTARINNASSDNIGSQASLSRPEGWAWGESTEIKTTTADALAFRDHWPSVRLIKLDIEGAELAALQGMEALIERNKPVLTVEWNVATAAAFGYHPRDIVAFLQNRGYTPMMAVEKSFIRCPTLIDEASRMLWYFPLMETAAPM